MKKQGFETLQLHAGQSVDAVTNSRAVPIYQTNAYVFNDTDHAQDLFELKAAGNIYTRIQNPTTDVLEKRIAALEGVPEGMGGALALASGSAATLYSVLNITEAEQNIVAANTVYGGTFNLFAQTLPRYGITTRFVDPDDIQAYENAIDENTKLIFVEVLGNPNCNIIDLQAVADVAHRHGIPFVVDNTFGSPYLINPRDFGADIVVHSATKFICGNGTSMGGILVDCGTFPWDKYPNRFPMLNLPDPSYHGVSYTQTFGSSAFIVRARVILLRDTGACISPFNSFLMLLGCETLSLRMERYVENAKKIVEFLERTGKVKVNHPLAEGNKYAELANKYFPKGCGSIFTIELADKATAKAFCDKLKLFSYVANVADAKSLVIHPASTTHSQLTEEQLLAAKITGGTVRISVGLESVDDLIEDLKQALA